MSPGGPPPRLRSGMLWTAAFLVGGMAMFGIMVVTREVRNLALQLVGLLAGLAVLGFAVPALERARELEHRRRRVVTSVPGFLGALSGAVLFFVIFG